MADKAQEMIRYEIRNINKIFTHTTSIVGDPLEFYCNNVLSQLVKFTFYELVFFLLPNEFLMEL